MGAHECRISNNLKHLIIYANKISPQHIVSLAILKTLQIHVFLHLKHSETLKTLTA